MHNELRYQAKIHTISAKLFKRENKILHIFPQNLFIFFLKKKKKTRKTCFNDKENKPTPSMCGKIKPIHKEKGSKLPI
jgi:hypothetical protein